MINWNDYPNFSESEFNCTHCGENHMKAGFLERLQKLRTKRGKAMRVTSGYRCPEHPIEARKSKPGAHASGQAADIGCTGQEAYEIMKLAFELGFTGIGVSQKGSTRFVHLDDIEESPRPNVWSY
jgi:zinc D-Ala-D-Ala carboxypeptidase